MVRLIDEPIDTWQPVKAYKFDSNTFVISRKQDYPTEIEEWEFVPGTIVLARSVEFSSGYAVAAIGWRKYYRVVDGRCRWCYPDVVGHDDEL